ncbi:MAG: response regulator [Calditrichia bacterium]
MYDLLIVDDERDILDTLTEAFVAVGHRVTGVDNGLQALEIFKNNRFDLAILDVELPEMNGLELTAEIKALAPDFPIILMTGYSHLYRPQDVLSLDVEAFLKKPLNIPDLIKIVNQILSRKRSNGDIL